MARIKFSPKQHLETHPELISEEANQKLRDFLGTVYRKGYHERIDLTKAMMVPFLMPPCGGLSDVIKCLKALERGIFNSLDIKRLGGLPPGTKVMMSGREGIYEIHSIQSDCYIRIKGLRGSFSPSVLSLV